MDLRKYVYNNHWTLGFSEDNLDEIVHGTQPTIHWMNNPYKNRWFADPFILDVTDDYIFVLVEEYYDQIKRGRISKLTIKRKNYQLEKVDVVLELPTHLSFPAIKRVGGDIFIYPENGASNQLVLYRYNPTTNACKIERILAEGYLADAIITDLFGADLMFVTMVPNHNGKVLLVYTEEDTQYKEKEQIHFESDIARNAGDWFLLKGKIYRPCQDCTERYGGAVILQEVQKKGDRFCFKDVNKIDASYDSYQLGCHTFNHYKGVIVVDVNGYRRPLLAKTIGAIMRLVRAVIK